MRKIMERNHFFWLTFSLVGLMITGAYSRDVSENWTLELIEYSSIALLLVSLASLRTKRLWGKSFVILIGIMLTVNGILSKKPDTSPETHTACRPRSMPPTHSP